MIKKAKVDPMKIIILSGLLLLAVLLAMVAVQRYYAYKQNLQNLKIQKARLTQLQQDIEVTTNSIDYIKKEQEEFKTVLFEERDVPAFLDGISGSAQKSLVYVVEMKTQQFNKVPIPKSMVDPNKALVQAVHSGNSQGYASQDVEGKLSDMLTLASMPIHFKIHGTFEAIVNFLSSIENYRQLLTVSNVEISSRPDYPQLNCEFTLNIYSLKKFKDIKI